jgi:hypothetical protein
MLGRCENYNYDFNYENKTNYSSGSDNYEDEQLENNKYYQDLKKNIPISMKI